MMCSVCQEDPENCIQVLEVTTHMPYRYGINRISILGKLSYTRFKSKNFWKDNWA